jgi:hypothetical protein
MIDTPASSLDLPAPSSTVTSYRPYPLHKPFVNTEWYKQTAAVSKGFPESNRDSKDFNFYIYKILF